MILSKDKIWLEKQISPIQDFLSKKLKLTLNPGKIFIKTLFSGVDFLGWVNFPDHCVLRTTTKRRMFKRIAKNQKPETINSYLGLLGYGNTFKIQRAMDGRFEELESKYVL